MHFMIDSIDIARYTDDNTSNSVEKSQCDQKRKLEKASVKLFKWSRENGLKANQDKCHFLPGLNMNTKFLLPACLHTRKLRFSKNSWCNNRQKVEF